MSLKERPALMSPAEVTDRAGRIVWVLMPGFRRLEMTRTQRDILGERRVLEHAERIGNSRKAVTMVTD
jgi:hypothetical protein